MVITEIESWHGSLPVTLAIQAADRARSARSPSTLRAYASDWLAFGRGCDQLGIPATPSPAVVSIYLDQLARRGAKMSTIRRRLAAINHRLRMAGSPALSARDEPLASVLQGLRRELGTAPRQARPIETAELRELAASCGKDLKGVRDRALLLLGFASALRRSEIVGLDWDAEGDGSGWLQPVAEGLRLRLRRSKTNQGGEFEEVAVCRGQYSATCPVTATEDWLAMSGGGGPVFRSVDRAGQLGGRLTAGSVSRILKATVSGRARGGGATEEEIAATTALVSGHSLRAGLVTSAFSAGLTAEDVMRQTRHRDVKVLLGYRRHATAFVGNVSGRVGL